MTRDKNISSAFSVFAVIADLVLIALLVLGGIWNLLYQGKLIGVVILVICIALFVFFAIGSARVAAVSRDDCFHLKFNYLIIPGHGQIALVVSVKKMKFRKYPRYLVVFVDASASMRSMVVIPRFRYRDEATFKDIMRDSIKGQNTMSVDGEPS
jgi:hypothetical protein